ncbi:MAG: hypothetical protein EXR77_00405 [Myxococcales bacterium]|nr:hypothetical protein [Myxococcales bacterium]
MAAGAVQSSMASFTALTAQWPDLALREIERLSDPAAIADWLNRIAAVDWSRLHSPLTALRDRQVHPLDGGLMAAAALRRLGYRPTILALNSEQLTWTAAMYCGNNHGGWVACHPVPQLQFSRVPTRSLRSLVAKLQACAAIPDAAPGQRVCDLSRFDAHDWMTDDGGAELALEAVLARLAPEGETTGER